MRPDDIPQDVWDAASKVATAPRVTGALFNENYVLPVARAILAERERCLKRVAYWGKAAGHSDDGSFGALLGILKGGE